MPLKGLNKHNLKLHTFELVPPAIAVALAVEQAAAAAKVGS